MTELGGVVISIHAFNSNLNRVEMKWEQVINKYKYVTQSSEMALLVLHKGSLLRSVSVAGRERYIIAWFCILEVLEGGRRQWEGFSSIRLHLL